MTSHLKPYIQTLIKNIDSNTVPSEIDLVFDSGALNGFMAYGAAMYIRALEEAKVLRVRRVSGCSAGAMVALMYLINIYYDIDPFFTSLLKHYHAHRNLSEYMVKMREIIDEHLTDDLSELNGRLFITFFDTEKRKQVVVSHYTDRAELIDCLARSSHIPYVSNPIMKYQDRYVDGVTPYMFEKGERRILFVKLVHMSNVFRLLNVRNETNSYSRVLEGVFDANSFFTRGRSPMCSYVDTWWRIEFILMRIRIFIFLTAVRIVERFRFIHRLAPKVVAWAHCRLIDWFKN